MSRRHRRQGQFLALALVGLLVLVVATAAYGVEGAAWAMVAQGILYVVGLGMRVIKFNVPPSDGTPCTVIDHD